MTDENIAQEPAPITPEPSTIVVSQPELKFVSDIAQPPVAPVEQAAPVVEVAPAPAPVAPVPERAAEPEKKEDPKPGVDRYAQLVDRALKKERLSYLKGLGINSEIMSDDHILTLSPDVDVETPEGKLAIDQWRAQENNERLFVKAEASEINIEEISADYKGSAHGTFGKDLFVSTLRRLAGK